MGRSLLGENMKKGACRGMTNEADIYRDSEKMREVVGGHGGVAAWTEVEG